MTTRTTPGDDGYALDLTGPVQHIARELGTHPNGQLSIEDLAAGYKHFAGDLARVRKHENLDNDGEAITWLISRAVSEMTLASGRRGKTQLTVDENGWVSLAPGVKAGDLKWRGQTVYTPPDIHQVLGDPFNPMSGRFAGNVRKNTGKDDTSELEASMRAVGWLPGHKAVKDARTQVTITGHRRLKVAAKLRAEGLDIKDDIEYVDFELDGEGDPADVHRMDTALLSNFGFRQITPEERGETALWLSEKRNMSQQQIAKVLGVSQQTVSRDLNKIVTQMGTELEPLIAQATAGIHRGLTQSQIGAELGMANNSMTLAKAFAVAADRLRREAEAELRARDAANAPIEVLPPEVSGPVDEFLDDPSTGTTRERPAQGDQGDVDDSEPPSGAAEDFMRDNPGMPPIVPPRAVNPPQDLPPAPQPYADLEDDSGVPPGYGGPLSGDWSWDESSQRWIVQRGTAQVTCRLPQDTPPVFPAHLFGVQLASPRGE